MSFFERTTTDFNQASPIEKPLSTHERDTATMLQHHVRGSCHQEKESEA